MSVIIWDDNSGSFIFHLMSRGLKVDQVDRAMRKMVGHDWHRIHVAEWRKRLQDKGFVVHSDSDADKFVDDLEALITGTNTLEDLRKFPIDGRMMRILFEVYS